MQRKKRKNILKNPERKIEYDKEADALYIQLKEASAEDSIEGENGVVVDVDSERHVIGLEVLNASKRLTLSDLTNISIQSIPLKEAA